MSIKIHNTDFIKSVWQSVTMSPDLTLTQFVCYVQTTHIIMCHFIQECVIKQTHAPGVVIWSNEL